MQSYIAEKPTLILKTNRLNIVLSTNCEAMMKFEARVRDTGDAIGHTSLQVTDRSFGRVGELSYELFPAFRGQCYATEILRGILAYSYADLGLVSLYGLAPEKNLAAQYVLQRTGFALNEELDGFIRYVAWNPRFQTVRE